MDVVSRKNADHYSWGSNCDGWHLLRNSKLSVIEERVPPGAGETHHYHQDAQQFFYVISGQVTVQIEDKTFHLAIGEGIFVKPGQPHQLMNAGEVDARFLVISAPPSHGDKIVVD